MATNTWTGGTSTAWNNAGNWSQSNWPGDTGHLDDDVVIPDTTALSNAPTLHASITVNSLSILTDATITGGGNVITVSEKSTASGAGTYSVYNNGTISGNLDLIIATTSNNLIRLMGSSGNCFQKVTFSSAVTSEYVQNAYVEDLAVNAGTFTHYSSSYTLTVEKSCSVGNAGNLNLGSATVSLGTLSVTNSASATLSFSSATTTITLNPNSTHPTWGFGLGSAATVNMSGGTIKFAKVDSGTRYLQMGAEGVHVLNNVIVDTNYDIPWAGFFEAASLDIQDGNLNSYGGSTGITITGNLTVGNGTDVALLGYTDDSNGFHDQKFGAVDIAANGTLKSSNQTMSITSGNFNNTGTFTHNDGMVKFTHATNTQNMQSAGTAEPTFYKLDNAQPAVGGASVVVWKSITVIHTLSQSGGRYFQFKGDQGSLTVTLGSSTVACTVTEGNRCLATLSGAGPVNIYGADQSKPFVITTGGPNHACTEVHYKWGDYTSETFNTQHNITIDGDMKFGAFNVNTGDELDLNGQTVEFTGLLTSTGTLACGTNALVVADSVNTSSTTSGNMNLIETGDGHTHTLTSSTITNWMLNGGTISNSAHGHAADNIIVGAGKLDVGNNLASGTPLVNVTTATGAELDGNTHTITMSGDFTTSGGLIGKSGLDFDGSTATTSPFTFLDVPYDLSNLQNSDATFEMWINPESKSGDAKIAGVINGYVGGQTNRWQLDHMLNDTFNFNSHENNQSINFSVNIGKMNHIALVFDDSENLLQIYHDGKLVGQNTLGTGIDLGTVGADPDLGISWQTTAKDTIRSNYMGFKGQFYMYRIFNTARTPAQLRADMFNTHGNMASTTGLQVMYQFDEGTGGAGDKVANKEGTTSRDGVLANAGAAPNWVGAGTFTYGTSTIDMTGDGTIGLAGGVTSFNNLKVAASGKTTNLSILAGSSDIRFFGTLTHGGGTASSSGNPTWTMRGSSTVSAGSDWSNWYLCYWESSTAVPAATWKYWIATTNSTLAGDMTCTGYFRPHQSVVNSGDYTITTYNALFHNTGGLNMGAGSLIFTHTQGLSDTTSLSVFTAGPGATVTGVAGKSTFKSQNNFAVVGKIENLDVTNEELKVTGQVINCTGDIHQYFPTIDHAQQLDADTADDRDVTLTRDLDKNTELINS